MNLDSVYTPGQENDDRGSRFVYTPFVPNQRSAGQKLLTIPVDEEFFAIMDQGVEVGGFASRSDLARRAIRDALEAIGVEVPRHLMGAPVRGGRGGKASINPENAPKALSDDQPVARAFAAEAIKRVEDRVLSRRRKKGTAKPQAPIPPQSPSDQKG